MLHKHAEGKHRDVPEIRKNLESERGKRGKERKVGRRDFNLYKE